MSLHCQPWTTTLPNEHLRPSYSKQQELQQCNHTHSQTKCRMFFLSFFVYLFVICLFIDSVFFSKTLFCFLEMFFYCFLDLHIRTPNTCSRQSKALWCVASPSPERKCLFDLKALCTGSIEWKSIYTTSYLNWSCAPISFLDHAPTSFWQVAKSTSGCTLPHIVDRRDAGKGHWFARLATLSTLLVSFVQGHY